MGERIVSWPPAYDPEAYHVAPAARRGLPDRDQLDWFNKAATAILLLLALPWLVLKLLADPRAVMRGAADHHLS